MPCQAFMNFRPIADGLAPFLACAVQAAEPETLGGALSDPAGLMRLVPVTSREQVEQRLKRLNPVPRHMDPEIDIRRRGLAAGGVTSRDALDRAIQQLDGQLPPKVEDGPFYAPFRKLGNHIPAADRAALKAAGLAAVQGQVLPSKAKLRRFLVEEYAAKAPPNGVLSNDPDGQAVDEMEVRHQPATHLGAAEIHAIGQRELKRLRAEMVQGQAFRASQLVIDNGAQPLDTLDKLIDEWIASQ
jgi:uncharacterized protein (DUF885 family)